MSSMSIAVAETNDVESNPGVTVLADGTRMVSWRSQTGLEAQLYSNLGEPVGSVFTILDGASGLDTYEISELPNGGFVVVWETDSTSDLNCINVQSFGADGSASSNVALVSRGGFSGPEIAVDENGGYAVAFTGSIFEVNGQDVYCRYYDENGETSNEAFYSLSLDAPEDQRALDIVVFDDGSIGGAFSSGSDGDSATIQYQRMDRMGNLVQWSGFGAFDPPVQSLEMVDLSDGNYAALAIVSRGEPGARISALQLQTSGVGFIELDAVEGTINDCAITELADGSYVVVWSKQIDSEGSAADGIYALRFSREGEPWPNVRAIELRGSAEGAVLPSNLDVSDLGDGSYVITWERGGDIFAERFDNYNNPTEFTGALGLNVAGNQNDEVLCGREFNDTISGHMGNDIICGENGQDILNGDEGHDILSGGAGADNLNGGSGFDWAFYDTSPEAVAVNLGDGNAESGGDAEGDVLTNIERVFGSIYSDILTGDDSNNMLSGNRGHDILRGGAGADHLNGGAGFDWAFYDTSSAGVVVNLGDGAVETGGDAQDDVLINIERVFGSIHNDILTGDGNNNILSGNRGHDILRGGAGADHLNGGVGFDWAFYDTSSSGVVVNLGDGVVEAGGDAQGDVLTNIERIFGSIHNDILTGDSTDNMLSGNRGHDILRGGAGADHLNGGVGFDWAFYDTSSSGVVVNLGDGAAESGGDAQGDVLIHVERVFGSTYDDELTGDSNNNILSGNGGDDVLQGAAGNDQIDGGAGTNILSGGTGNDVFVFRTAGSYDTIQDFEDGSDLIRVALGVMSFADITVRDAGADVILEFADVTVTLENFDHTHISASDFEFV